MKDKILITGGAGYIGSELTHLLLKSNKKIIILDNFLYKNEKIFSKKYKDLKIIKGDITNTKDVKKAMKDVSKVIHLAGLVGDPACSLDPKLTKKINIDGTQILIEQAIKNKVSNFIFASSCSVYGITKKTATERTKPNPISLYSETKIISEKSLLSINKKDLKITILRFSTIFGASKRPRYDLAANIFTADAFYKKTIKIQGGSQWRPFIHVKDVAKAIELVLNSSDRKIAGEIFNVGDDEMVITISNLAKKVKKSIKSKNIKIVKTSTKTDSRNYRVSFRKINKILGFKKTISFDEGITEMIEIFEKKKSLNYKNPIYSNVETLKLALKNSPEKN